MEDIVPHSKPHFEDMNRGEIVTTVRKVVDADDAVALAYLFGSVVAGRAGGLSDIDIAVLLTSRPFDAAYGRLMDQLCLALRTDRVDLILLNTAASPLKYRIIRDGILLFCREEKVREDFESESILQYLDFKPVREHAFEVARKQLLDKT